MLEFFLTQYVQIAGLLTCCRPVHVDCQALHNEASASSPICLIHNLHGASLVESHALSPHTLGKHLQGYPAATKRFLSIEDPLKAHLSRSPLQFLIKEQGRTSW